MSDRTEIKAMLDEYRTAVHAKDLKAFMALYDDNVRVFDLWGSWFYLGAGEWRKPAEEWFRSLGADRSSPEFRDVEMEIGEGLAAVNAIVTYRGMSAGGKELRSMDNRITWVLRKHDGGEWKIIHEHTSAPADIETGKVTLKR